MMFDLVDPSPQISPVIAGGFAGIDLQDNAGPLDVAIL